MENEKLLPCPFCNSSKITFLTGHAGDGKNTFAQCVGCGVTSDWYANEKQAAKAWNTRYSPQPNDADVVEVMEKVLYDRTHAQAALKALSDNGYRITKIGE